MNGVISRNKAGCTLLMKLLLARFSYCLLSIGSNRVTRAPDCYVLIEHQKRKEKINRFRKEN